MANLAKIMTRIGGVCLITIGAWCIIELAVQFGHYGHGCKMGEGEAPASAMSCLETYTAPSVTTYPMYTIHEWVWLLQRSAQPSPTCWSSLSVASPLRCPLCCL